MSGIMGYIGNKQAVPLLLAGIDALDYQGYDAAGLAVLEGEEIRTFRSQGDLTVFKEQFGGAFGAAKIGISHICWAAHGHPSGWHAHTHTDDKEQISLVHSGLIVNAQELREQLISQGHTFSTESDSEVLPHLIACHDRGNLLQAMHEAAKCLQGSYTAIALSKKHPDMLVAIKKGNPLIIGIGEDGHFLASDLSPLRGYVRKIILLEDGEMALLTPEGAAVYRNMMPVEKEIINLDEDLETAQKGGYQHFMLKEIHEQPRALRQVMKGRITGDKTGVEFPGLSLDKEKLAQFSKIYMLGCGTAYHAGVMGKYMMEKLLRIPVEVDIASEFRYRDPLVDSQSLVVVVSQSGETADTLGALEECKKRGAHILAITNVADSTISRESDDVIYTWAGPEIAIASTKAYLNQLAALYMLTLFLAKTLGKLEPGKIKELIEHFYRLPEQVEEVLSAAEAAVKEIAGELAPWEDCFFIGRGMDYAVALEGALKLKETSYIHAAGYASGELKHGTMALIADKIPMIAICTQSALMEKTLHNMKEFREKGAYMISVAFQGMEEVRRASHKSITLPETLDIFAPILAVVPLQLLAYYTAAARNCNIDQPRNLSKSLMVE